MKTNPLLFILIMMYSFLGTTLAQDSLLVDQVEVDNLLTLINESQENGEKVRLLNEYARLNFYNQEYKAGLIAAVDGRKLSAEIDFSDGEVMFHITVATFLGRGDLKEYHLRQAHVLSGNSIAFDSYFVPSYPKGYPRAMDNGLIDKLSPVLSFFEKPKNKEIQAIIIDRLVFSNYSQSNYKKVQVLHKKAINLYTDLDQLYPLLLYHNYRMKMVNEGHTVGDKEQLENELREVLTRNTDQDGLIRFYHQLANFYSQLGQSGIAIDYFLKSVAFFKSTNNLIMLNEVYNEMSLLYGNLEMYDKQAEIDEKRVAVVGQLGNPEKYSMVYFYSVWSMKEAKRYDKAREYMELTIQFAPPDFTGFVNNMKVSLEGQILKDQNRCEEALPLLRKSYNFYSLRDDEAGRNTTPWEAMHLATCYYQTGDLDEALKFGSIALELLDLKRDGAIRLDRLVNKVLYEIYNAVGEELQAFNHLKYYHDLVEKTKLKDNAKLLMETEVRSVLKKNQIEINQLEQGQIIKDQQNKNQRLWIFSIAGALLSTLLIAFVLYRNNKNKQKANGLLKEQKEEIQSTLDKLKSTQAQLIQSEKMASLGELTAGIAHEIQNPLNFVNNFSEVSNELIDEMNEEIEKGDINEAKLIAADIKQNLSKINHHGKRADAIVKGMLQHSRKSTAEKEPTDINKLADEYLRLAYHGLRAKDKSFNATLETDFDENMGLVNVIPQDMGRVILNLITNAFYAVNEKKTKTDQTGVDYEPTVSVSTKKVKDQILISVRDNGNGMPSHVVEKIFQPFFTTKPTGKGTGLGLSMSYDIVTKGHGGELKVETKEGKGLPAEHAGTTFMIQLPTVTGT